MIRNEYIKKCPECEEAFEATRLNQKFCSVECKNRFNNRNTMLEYHERKQEDLVTREINKILYQNHSILKQYLGQEVALSKIEKQGFNLNHITGFRENSKGDYMVFLCYDVAYLFLNEEKVRVFSS